MLLGCSNLTGRYWVGSLWYYPEPMDAPSVEKALTGLECDNGVVEGFFVGNEGKNVRPLSLNFYPLTGIRFVFIVKRCFCF